MHMKKCLHVLVLATLGFGAFALASEDTKNNNNKRPAAFLHFVASRDKIPRVEGYTPTPLRMDFLDAYEQETNEKEEKEWKANEENRRKELRRQRQKRYRIRLRERKAQENLDGNWAHQNLNVNFPQMEQVLISTITDSFQVSADQGFVPSYAFYAPYQHAQDPYQNPYQVPSLHPTSYYTFDNVPAAYSEENTLPPFSSLLDPSFLHHHPQF